MTKKVTKKLPAKSADQEKKKAPRGKHPNQVKNQIKKGQVLNPKGAAAHDPFKREVKMLTSKALAEITSMVCEMTVEEVQRIINSPTLTLAQKTILRAALDASEHGQIDKFNTIVSRVMGTIPQVVHIESPDGSMSPNKNLSEEELKSRINAKLDEIAAAKNEQ